MVERHHLISEAAADSAALPWLWTSATIRISDTIYTVVESVHLTPSFICFRLPQILLCHCWNGHTYSLCSGSCISYREYLQAQRV